MQDRIGKSEEGTKKETFRYYIAPKEKRDKTSKSRWIQA